ncbi:type II secretion system protein GspE [Zophobihabitans entericus]|uniref:Type II secretion system protein GspE n=1 Tax=Zophobihabitans entericus TaxID=1635327 RepID=A0A6G9IC78_9GAMM|nr:type II secretion system protein GspE [Zophobihabitans entericus]QIQ21838.1 type II secretion system protein GspE [Zophobihabitans entericus]
MSPYQSFSLEILNQCVIHQVVPISLHDKHLEIAASEHSLKRDAALRFALGCTIQVTIWSEHQLTEAFKQVQSYLSAADNKSLTQEETSIIKLVNDILINALNQRASDIHFEPYQDSYRIRFRIDGVLQHHLSPPRTIARQIAARLKIMGQLNIAEHRLPQDGLLVITHYEQQFSMRISTLPVNYGEKIVLRVIESNQQHLDISQLGLAEEALTLYQQVLNNSQGLILVTGPTGSGKTMTLYSGLKELNQEGYNICSIEDPIEIPLSGINQTQINTKSGLTFAHTLRSFLRQDPDVIMVGEIRDTETAEIAVQAAQTGHLVLSTLHTNSSYETLIRLNQMGIANYLLASSLKLVIAQRLIRKLCPYCKQNAAEPITIETNQQYDTFQHWIPVGCEHCLSGYYQRIGVYELLIISPEIQALLLSSQSFSVKQIQTVAQQQGMQSLYQSGLSLVKQGITSYSELVRVLDN